MTFIAHNFRVTVVDQFDWELFVESSSGVDKKLEIWNGVWDVELNWELLFMEVMFIYVEGERREVFFPDATVFGLQPVILH